uniref:Histonelysine Nmethyltransferase SETMARlike [Megachile rotundata] n=1 Tax=Lepeophtheirus salmonis TaxID=72036 RepID=A0A0K2VAF9_LEPSM
MRRVAARLSPKYLNFVQKQYCEEVSLDMLDRPNSDPTFTERIITVDETWVYEFNMQTSLQSSEWGDKKFIVKIVEH